MTDNESLPYRPCVGMILINDDGHVFVGHRLKMKLETGWQMPQGGIDEGETPEQAAFRELLEEVGTDKAVILSQSEEWLTYDLPDDLIGKQLRGYRGQKQKWFAMRFTGTDADIDLAYHHPEFDRWKWVDINALPGLIVEFKRPLYEELVRIFAQFAQPVD